MKMNININELEKHYKHACEKHPYFADKWDTHGELREKFARDIKYDIICNVRYDRPVSVSYVLDGELHEVFTALFKGDMEQSRYEIYDVIAVLMRMLDVIDGRAKFGKPEVGESEVAK